MTGDAAECVGGEALVVMGARSGCEFQCGVVEFDGQWQGDDAWLDRIPTAQHPPSTPITEREREREGERERKRERERERGREREGRGPQADHMHQVQLNVTINQRGIAGRRQN